jgi:hypothetical protein
LLVGVAALALLFGATPAHADQITMTFQGIVGTPATVPAGDAGVMQWTTASTQLAGGTVGTFPGTGSGPSLNTFCLDPLHDIPYNQQLKVFQDTFTVISATPNTMTGMKGWDNVNDLGGSQTVATNLLDLFGTFFSGLTTANDAGYGLSVADQYAAFQEAIWLLEGASGVGVKDSNPNVLNLAKYFVNNLGSIEAPNLVIFQSTDGGQDQIGVVTPAPPSALLAVVGFLSVAGGYRFRRRRQVAG